MYKPPQNTNRVQAIKSRFENGSNVQKTDVKLEVKLNNNSLLKFEKIENESRKIEAKLKAELKTELKVELKTESSVEIATEEVCASVTNQENPPCLLRQLSDPTKRNIKRSQAFRRDKSLTEKSLPFQRGSLHSSCRTRNVDDKVKLFDKTRLEYICDNDKIMEKNNDCITSSNTTASKTTSKSINTNSKPAISKSNGTTSKTKSTESSPKSDFSSLRRKFNTDDHFYENNNSNNVNLSLLYSEPIPKAFRNNSCRIPTTNNDKNLQNDKTEHPISIHNASTLKVSDKPTKSQKNITNLTDTLKNALKKPLPPGPAPKKPPRTFLHSPVAERSPLNLDSEFTKHLNLNLTKTPPLKSARKLPTSPTKNGKTKSKNDPKYMLDKLENALRNNRIKLKRQKRVEYNTSGEDSDDFYEKKGQSEDGNSSKVDSKLQGEVSGECKDEKVEVSNACSNLYTQPAPARFNLNDLNCLPSLSCTAGGNNKYERVPEPNSSFFVGANEEPVYAEPFQHSHLSSVDVSMINRNSTAGSNQTNRNSLYYMSSPVVQLDDKMSVKLDLNDEQLKEASPVSTPSDLESPTVSSADEKTLPATPGGKIKNLIEAFEPKRNSLDRVDQLECQLRRTLDRFSGHNSSTSNASTIDEKSNDGKDAVTEKYETYVRTVRMQSRKEVKRRTKDFNLFHCCLLVGLNGNNPYVKYKFPQNVETPSYIEQLIFPDSVGAPMDYSHEAQNYSLVLTTAAGERQYGYCRRVLPEGSRSCLPLAYCILSKQRAPRFYRRILQELESRHGIPDKIRDILINEIYYHKFPKPGDSVKFNLSEVNLHLAELNGLVVNGNNKEMNSVQQNGCRLSDGVDLSSFVNVDKRGEYGSLNRNFQQNNDVNRVFIDSEMSKNSIISTPSELILTLHQDSRFKEKDLEELCKTLSSNILQKVFASILLERKVIFISCVLGKLSTCIEAIQNIIYPFSWPHTLIPVLPQTLWEIVEAPTPVIAGVLSVSVVNNYNIENGIVVDLDEGAILVEVGDEAKILPTSLLKVWKEGLTLANSSSSQESACNVLLSDAFIRIFIESCGHYKQYITNGVFQKTEFISHPKSKGVRRFLKWFTETTMFCYFVDIVLTDRDSFNIFDKRIEIYSSQDAALILEKLKDWKR